MTVTSGGAIPALIASIGRAVPMPDANSDVTSVLLHRDPVTRARTLAVAFPAGFARLVPGRYPAGEEVVVLSGELRVAGMRLAAGDWAWLPARLLRRDLSSAGGCVVYAWFSGPNDWQPSEEELPVPPARMAALGRRARLLRGNSAGDGPGRSALVTTGEQVTGPAELLDLSSLSWRQLETGERQSAGPGQAFVRWPDARPAGES